MRRTSRRAARKRARALRPNLTGGGKLLAIGGIVAAGGAAAYALLRTPAGPPPPPPGSAAAAALAAQQQQCDQMQQQLVQLRAGSNPDAAAMQRLEANIASCISQVRAGGGNVDNAMSDLSAGDAAYQHAEDKFGEYKATDYSDALKRNNLRQEILNSGAGAAASYAAAASQAADLATARAVRQSIIRALAATISRRLCYLYDQPGCGRFAVNEDHGNDKAGQEYSRVIKPLFDAHGLAVQRIWTLGQLDPGDNALYFAAMMLPCLALRDYINAKFNEYKGVDYADALRRNNLRQEILGSGRTLATCVNDALNDAIGYKSLPDVRTIAKFILAALGDATARWICFITGANGCDRFALNEDAAVDKAGQEFAATIDPLSTSYMTAAHSLVWWGDTAAYEPLIALKLTRCAALNAYVDSKFGEYKSVDYADAIRRNNLRQVVLQYGGYLVGNLQDAMNSALTGASAQTAPVFATAIMQMGTPALRTALGPSMFTAMLPSTTPAAPAPGTSGLGQLLSPSTPMLAPIRLSPITAPASKPSAAPSASDPQQAVLAAGIRMVSSVIGVAKTALDSAITRQLCYLFSQPGCDRFGVNEDAGSDKAAQENAQIVTPLMGIVQQGTNFLVSKGDPNGELPLITSKLRICTALFDHVNQKFAEYKTVDWSDAVRRNNLRVGEVMGTGRNMVACFRSTNPTTAAGRSLVKTAVDAAIQASQDRVNCYNDSSSQCGRFGWNEDDNATKAAQETNDILNPLTTISSRLASGQSLSGFGQFDMSSATPWLGLAAIAGGLWWLSKQSPQRVHRNKVTRRSKKRTSRRVYA